MRHLIISLGFFFLAAVIHVRICRDQPGLLIKTFLGLAVAGLAGVCTVFFSLNRNAVIVPHPSLWMIDLSLTATLSYILLIPTYLIFYVNTRLVSPSQKVLMLIKDRGGLSYTELLRHFDDEELIAPRLADLVTSGCVCRQAENYWLSPHGVRIGKFLDVYQKILGRGMGG